MVNVFIDKGNVQKELSFTGSVSELCHALNLNQEEVIVTRNNELLVAQDTVHNTDRIKILYVLSGG